MKKYKGTPAVRMPPLFGETFDKLTPIEEVGVTNGVLYWMFRCTCGAVLRCGVYNARHNAKKGWSSCPACWKEAHPKPEDKTDA